MEFEYVRMSTVKQAEKHSSESGHWIVANVKQAVGWSEDKIIVYFRDVPILLIPEKPDTYPAVAVRCKNGISQEKAREIINHFLSSLVWSKGKIVKIELWGGGNLPRPYGKSRDCMMLSKPFRIMYLPDISNPEARLALAFYREAMGINHPAYSFLSFYKIINIKFDTGDKQKKWIKNTLSKVEYHDGKMRLDSLCKDIGSEDEISKYLYHSCRCAIAHADINQKIINPEDYEDMRRLRLDLPLIRALAEILIEDEFDVWRPHTVHKSHPYELFGFKSILGNDVTKQIANDSILTKNVSFPEKISLRLWGKPLYDTFEHMKIVSLTAKKGELIVAAISCSDTVSVVFGLNFNNERIVFNPQTSIRMNEDDGSMSFAESILDIHRFLREYWMNGILEIWDVGNNKCLGFSDAFIPVNIDMSRTVQDFNRRIKEYEKEVKKRKDSKED